MITREQLADLQPGDVVELAWPDGTTLRGPLAEKSEPPWLYLGPILLRTSGPWNAIYPLGHDNVTLTVISRAPKPLYVNHPRTEPVDGDVVRDADAVKSETWYFQTRWWDLPGSAWLREQLPASLRLLVDGETGQVVPGTHGSDGQR